MASVTAMENALGIESTEQTHDLRVLLTMGERIRSHAAHTYLLALPDYVGQPNAIAIAADKPDAVKMAIALMKAGNDMVRVIGGRDMHPESCTVGGWLHIPEQAKLDELRARLETLRPGAVATVELFNSLPYPDFHHGAEHFSLHNDKEYVSLRGPLKSEDHEFRREDYLKFVQEYHEPDMTANFVVREGHTYMVGALSRVNNNFDQLSPEAQRLAKAGKLMDNFDNPYYNNLAQAVELLAAVDQSIEMLGRLKVRNEPLQEIKPHACRGVGTVEVPRGTLWHEYELDDTGHILHCNIIAPTTQNLRSINDDLRQMLPSVKDMPRPEMADTMEKMIRSYDPCLSCAAHFLKIEEI